MTYLLKKNSDYCRLDKNTGIYLIRKPKKLHLKAYTGKMKSTKKQISLQVFILNSLLHLATTTCSTTPLG